MTLLPHTSDVEASARRNSETIWGRPRGWMTHMNPGVTDLVTTAKHTVRDVYEVQGFPLCFQIGDSLFKIS